MASRAGVRDRNSVMMVSANQNDRATSAVQADQ